MEAWNRFAVRPWKCATNKEDQSTETLAIMERSSLGERERRTPRSQDQSTTLVLPFKSLSSRSLSQGFPRTRLKDGAATSWQLRIKQKGHQKLEGTIVVHAQDLYGIVQIQILKSEFVCNSYLRSGHFLTDPSKRKTAPTHPQVPFWGFAIIFMVRNENIRNEIFPAIPK